MPNSCLEIANDWYVHPRPQGPHSKAHMWNMGCAPHQVQWSASKLMKRLLSQDIKSSAWMAGTQIMLNSKVRSRGFVDPPSLTEWQNYSGRGSLTLAAGSRPG